MEPAPLTADVEDIVVGFLVLQNVGEDLERHLILLHSARVD